MIRFFGSGSSAIAKGFYPDILSIETSRLKRIQIERDVNAPKQDQPTEHEPRILLPAGILSATLAPQLS